VNFDAYLIIIGQNGQTDRLFLKDASKSDKKNEFDFQSNNIGKV